MNLKLKLSVVILISTFLAHNSKAKNREPACSEARRRIKGVVQIVVHGKLRSDFQRVAIRVGVALGESGRMNGRIRVFEEVTF